MKIIIILFTITYFKSSIGRTPPHIQNWMVWNIGQGQWLSEILNDECHHYDFGGEIQYLNKIKKSFQHYCQNKINYLYLSHADFDHYSFANYIFNNSKRTCWAIKTDQIITRKIPEIPFCPKKLKSLMPTAKILFFSQIENSRMKNFGSIVFFKSGLLIPGDSPLKAEKIWSATIPTETKVLLLGHHGSRTSTSEKLLSKLPQLKMVIASQRTRKYGHPHPDVVQRVFKTHRLGIIKTEDWGSILWQQ